ncbi:MAG: Hsp20/alpha crystallin family protein [Chloroflexota bacterium]
MTKLVRWNPYRTSIFDEFDRLFDASFSKSTPTSNWSVAIDVVENDDAYIIEASVPGIAADDLDVTLEDNVLTLKGEVKSEEASENTQYHVRERRYGSFSRRVRFPVAVNGENIAATYENGILTLNVPKAEEVKPKKIEVTVS